MSKMLLLLLLVFFCGPQPQTVSRYWLRLRTYVPWYHSFSNMSLFTPASLLHLAHFWYLLHLIFFLFFSFRHSVQHGMFLLLPVVIYISSLETQHSLSISLASEEELDDCLKAVMGGVRSVNWSWTQTCEALIRFPLWEWSNICDSGQSILNCGIPIIQSFLETNEVSFCVVKG